MHCNFNGAIQDKPAPHGENAKKRPPNMYLPSEDGQPRPAIRRYMAQYFRHENTTKYYKCLTIVIFRLFGAR